MLETLVKRGGLIAVLGALLFAGWWLYDVGKLHGVAELESLRVKNSMLEKRNDKLADDTTDLREQVAILERSSQIDRQAAESVKAELGQLEEDLQAAREEVEFYRGIVSPGDVKPGLRIHRFALEAGAAPGEFHYDLVLTQLKHNDKAVSGVVDWRITGSMPEYQTEIGLERVTEPAVKELKFRFRYFQELAGTIRLPEGFTARQVVLTIRPAGKGKGKAEPIVQSFDWVATRS
ncbi:MAG: DUF6776 family protein [Gammaproteobacteria bacterium]